MIVIGTPNNSAKAHFAPQFDSRMKDRGWNQSGMARRATKCLPKPARGQTYWMGDTCLYEYESCKPALYFSG
jgi:hypothetical protein